MFYSLASCLFLALTYECIFYTSADTPLANASASDILQVLGIIVLASVLMSALVAAPYSLLRSIYKPQKDLSNEIEKGLVLFVLFIGFLLLIENLSYSLLGIGLKTSASWGLKIFFSSLACLCAYKSASSFVELGRVVQKKKALLLCLLGPLLLTNLVANSEQKVHPGSHQEPPAAIRKKYNVVVLSSDGVRADEMSIYGSQFPTTPFMNSKSSEFMVFTNAYTNSANTTGSIASILTGISPLTSKVVYPPDIMTGVNSSRSLPRILGGHGYYRALWAVPHYADAVSQNMVGAFNTNNYRSSTTTSSPLSIDSIAEFLMVDGLQNWFVRNAWKDFSGVTADALFIDELDNPFSYVTADPSHPPRQNGPHVNDVSRIKNTLLDIHKSSSEENPFFILVHLLNTHGKKFKSENRIFSEGMDQDVEWMLPFYHDAILDFDDAVKEIYNALQTAKQLENTILIVTSDHGMRWRRNERIPLLIRLPGSTMTGSHDLNAQLIDIAPTVLEALGLAIPQWMEGDSLLNPGHVSPSRYILAAGVLNNLRREDGMWARSEGVEDEFASTNQFSAVYCDYYMNSAYPIEFTPTKIPRKTPTVGCDDKPAQVVASEAKVLIENKLGLNSL